MDEVVEKYIRWNNKKYQRYNSWNHCYKAFENHSDLEYLALHLAFYLASWGMYRGSSKLLDKDFTVHIEPVKILKNNWQLRCSFEKDVTPGDLGKLITLIKSLSEYYESEHNVTPTDTLISKIILGSLGCLPAYDRFFKDGVKSKGENFKSLNQPSLIKLFDFVERKHENLTQLQKMYPQYPKMKLIDMYFWQLGYDTNNK